MPPLVSVCILTFNSSPFIAETVNSARNQTLQDLEIVIVDNCSTDHTLEICNELKSDDPRIHIYSNESPLGISGGLNRCLGQASGKYAKILMHDDILEPEFLERTVAILEHFPSVTLVGCSEQVIGEDGKQIRSLAPYAESKPVPGRELMKRMLFSMSNDIGTPSSMLMKRADYGAGFNRSLFLYLDMEMWLRALAKGDFYFLNEPLSRLRVHAKTGSTINSKTLLFVSDMLQMKTMYAPFMEEQGILGDEWERIVDARILARAGYVLFEEGITPEEVRACTRKLRAMVGYDYTDQLLESMALVIHYCLSRMFKDDLELRWRDKEIKRLAGQIDSMSKSLSWRIAEPFRGLRSKLFGWLVKLPDGLQ